MDILIIDFHYRPPRGRVYAAMSRTAALEVLVVGPTAPQSEEFAWAHLAQPGLLAPLAVRRNLKLARATRWIAVEPSTLDLLLVERLAKQQGATWEAWLDAGQGAAWSTYLVRRAAGQPWEAVPWRTGLRRMNGEAA